MSDVVVVGCGRIGAPLAVAFASRGVRVLGVDVDESRIADLSRGTAPDDDGLAEALSVSLASGALSFGPLQPSGAPRAFVVAVSTPVDAESRFVRGPLDGALAAVAAVAADDDLVVIRSTVPIGTTRAAAAAVGRPLRWSACPDRSTAGRALADQAIIPHIVGGLDEPSAEAAERLFAVIGPTRRVATPEAAEALKLFANVHRDMRFALANQFALICESAGVDFSEVRAAGAEGFPRFDVARAGPVGGPCLSKDVYLLDPAVRAGLLRGGRAVNDGLVDHVARLVRADLQAAGGAVAILGLAFKGDPPVRDQTGSFGFALAAVLRGADVAVRTWDPASAPASGRGSAIEGARVVILANDHPALADVSDLARPGCVVRDLCGVADRATAAGVDLRVFGEGAAHG